MKKVNFLGLIIMLVGGIISAQSIWTGSAAAGSSADFPGTSSVLRAKSNTFPPGTVLQVTNPRGGNSINVEVIDRLDTPGLLILLEESASNTIAIPKDYVLSVQVSPVSNLKLDNAVKNAPYSNIYNTDPDYNPVVVLEDEQTLQTYPTAVPYEAPVNTTPPQEQTPPAKPDIAYNVIPVPEPEEAEGEWIPVPREDIVREPIPKKPEEHKITYTVIPQEQIDDTPPPEDYGEPQHTYTVIPRGTPEETIQEEVETPFTEPAPPPSQGEKPKASRFNAGELAESSIEYYTKEKSGEWEEFTESKPSTTAASPLYKDPNQADDSNLVYDLAETSPEVVPEKKSNTLPFTEDKIAVEGPRYTEDNPAAAEQEPKSDIQPYTDDPLAFDNPRYTEDNPAAVEQEPKSDIQPYTDDPLAFDNPRYTEDNPAAAEQEPKSDIPPYTDDPLAFESLFFTEDNPAAAEQEPKSDIPPYTDDPLAFDNPRYTEDNPAAAEQEPKSDIPLYTDDPLAFESLFFTEDNPAAAEQEPKSDTQPYTEEKVPFDSPRYTEGDPAAGKSANKFLYTDDSALYTDGTPRVSPETAPEGARPRYSDDSPSFTEVSPPYDDKSLENTPNGYLDESSLYTKAPRLIDDKMLTDEDRNLYTDDTPAQNLDRPLDGRMLTDEDRNLYTDDTPAQILDRPLDGRMLTDEDRNLYTDDTPARVVDRPLDGRMLTDEDRNLYTDDTPAQNLDRPLDGRMLTDEDRNPYTDDTPARVVDTPLDGDMFTDEDRNPYTDDTPARVVDTPLLDKRSDTLADKDGDTAGKEIYFLKPDKLMPPKSEGWSSPSKNDILAAESASPEKSSEYSKDDTVDSANWIKRYALTPVHPGTGEQYVQVGAYSNVEVMKEAINKLKVSSPNYPLSYELNADSMVYRLLVGPLKPAEKAVVLRTMRSSLSPDAFHYSP